MPERYPGSISRPAARISQPGLTVVVLANTGIGKDISTASRESTNGNSKIRVLVFSSDSLELCDLATLGGAACGIDLALDPQLSPRHGASRFTRVDIMVFAPTTAALVFDVWSLREFASSSPYTWWFIFKQGVTTWRWVTPDADMNQDLSV